jgi:lipid-binding SYLF domain-containing protein
MRLLISTLLICLPLLATASPEEERKEIQEMHQQVLTKLYKEKSGSKSEVEKSKGYAVFSSLGINLFVVSTARGGGLLHDNRSNKDIYMNMFSAGAGLGLGVKDFSVVFIFNEEKALNDFIESGLDFSAQADATVETSEDSEGANAAATLVPGVQIYQMTESGIAVQATLQGTKYWKDDDLN